MIISCSNQTNYYSCIRNLFLWMFFICNGIAIGQEKIKDTIKTIEIDEVVITKSIDKKATGIITSSIINSATIETFSPLDITNSINQVPGVYALSGALNTSRITIRGIGARTPYGTDKLRLYYNNIPITNGAGSSTVEALDVENIGSIEVIKGPKGSLYGSNLGGAILISTKSSEENTTRLVNNLTIGSYDLMKNNINFQENHKNFSLRLSYNYTDLNGYRQNSNFHREGVLLDTKYKLNNANSIGLLINYTDYYAQISSSINQADFNNDPRKAAGNWLKAKGYEDDTYALVGMYYNGVLSNTLEAEAVMFYSYLKNYEARPFNILSEATNGYGFKNQIKGKFKTKNAKAKYTIGLELYKDQYKWSTYKNEYLNNGDKGSLEGEQLSRNVEYRNQLNFSGSILYPLANKFTVQLGLGVNYTTYDFRDIFNEGANNRNASKSFKPIFLPSLSLNYDWKEACSFFVNISRGFSNPSLEETLTPEGIINPEIEQEKGMSYEINTQMKFLDRNLWVNLSLYHMDINDLLVAQRIGEDQYIGRNAGKTQHQGLELDANYTISSIGKSIIKPFIRYSYNHHSFIDFIDNGKDFSGNNLTGVPRNKVDAGMYWLLNGFYWNATYQFVDQIPLTDTNSIYSKAFSIANTKIGYEKSINNKLSVGFSMGVNNVFNKKYAQSVLINAVGFGNSQPRYFYPGNNRNYYSSFKVLYRI